MANLYNVKKEDTEKRLKKFVKLFNMQHAINNQIRSYSHGMKQKICIIAALIHEPKLWILDEPLMGLDPQSAYDIKCYMKEHKKQGNTVFFSSHNIDMVEKLCDRVAIINKGRLIKIINVEEFMKKSKISLEEYFLKLTKDENKINEQLAEANNKKVKKSFWDIFKKKSKNLDYVLEENDKDIDIYDISDATKIVTKKDIEDKKMNKLIKDIEKEITQKRK